MLDMRGPRNAGEQRQNPKFISPMNTLPSKSIGQLFSKMKSTIKKFQEEALPEREREIRMAIEMRFNKSRANKEYIYGDGDSSPIGEEFIIKTLTIVATSTNSDISRMSSTLTSTTKTKSTKNRSLRRQIPLKTA